MPIISADQAKPEYDVVIVGSGAGGGQAAFTLTMAGLEMRHARGGAKLRPADRDADV